MKWCMSGLISLSNFIIKTCLNFFSDNIEMLSSPNQHALVGSDATIECKVEKGSLNVMQSWYHNGKEIGTPGKKLFTNSAFTQVSF